MSASIPETEPTSFIAGDTVEWTKASPDYLPGDGWLLSYVLNHNGTVTKIDGAAIVVDGDRFHVTISAAASAALAPGTYHFAAFVAKGTERHCIGAGPIEVKPNFAIDGTDPRSRNEQMLDAIRRALEGFATTDLKSFAIAGRQYTRKDYAELKQMESDYAWRVARENGRAPATQKVRFVKDTSVNVVPWIPKNKFFVDS